MPNSIKTLLIAGIATGGLLAIYAFFNMSHQTSPWYNVKSTVTEASRLLTDGDHSAFLKNVVPPAQLREMTTKRSFDELVVSFSSRKAKRLGHMLRAAQDIEPVYDDDGNTAIFHFQKAVSGENAIAFTRIGRRWYVASKKTVPNTTPGNLAPTFVAESVGGRKIESDDLRGKIVVLHFWATWCGPCIRQMPAHIDSLSQYDERDVEIIFICMDGNDEETAKTIDKYAIPFNNVLGPDGWSEYGANLLPMDVVIDHQGIIASNSIEDIPRLLGNEEAE